MSSTIRWCFTCNSEPQPSDSGMDWMTPGCEAINTCDVADALVIRAPIDYKAGCKAMEMDSMGWQTCSDDGDLESFTIGVDAAVKGET